jgi:hypothetical protein
MAKEQEAQLSQPSKPNWDEYTPIGSIMIFKDPETGDHGYAAKYGLFDDPRYIKWKSKSYIPNNYYDDAKDMIKRALILSHHLPWVANTYPFTLEMGEVEPHKGFPGAFIGSEEKHVHAVRFAYQQTTLTIPLFTRKEHDRTGVHDVPNTDFVNLWTMTGSQRVDWFLTTFMSKARTTARMISREADNAGLNGQQEAQDFMGDVEEILGSFQTNN